MTAITDRERFDGLAAGNGWTHIRRELEPEAVNYHRGHELVYAEYAAGGGLHFAERYVGGSLRDEVHPPVDDRATIDGWLTADAQ